VLISLFFRPNTVEAFADETYYLNGVVTCEHKVLFLPIDDILRDGYEVLKSIVGPVFKICKNKDIHDKFDLSFLF
jgi:hypothetical protein